MRAVLWIFCSLAVVAVPLPHPIAFAQSSGSGEGMTADEMLTKAHGEYAAGRYAEAIAGFTKFIADYGSAQETRAVIPIIRYPLAMSYLHLQKFSPALEQIEALLTQQPQPSREHRAELIFWKGVCQMQADDFDGARATFEQFVHEYPAAPKAPEALLLSGTNLLLQGKAKEASAYFAGVKPRLGPIDRGRATVLELYGLNEADDKDAALQLVVDEYPRTGDMLQIATFQSLSLQLGAQLLEAGEYRKAIQCLQRIWNRDRLLKHQEKRLADLEDALAAAEAQPRSDPYRKLQLKQMIAKVKRELENFRKIENFDSALRLRLATAFQAMDRFREAALILEEMLREMPPDPIVEAASVNLVQCWSAIERWPKAIEAAKAFEKKFPQSDKLPLVFYLEGIAEQRNDQPDAAVTTFDAILKRFSKSDYAPRALFMKGFSLLLAERSKEAAGTFEEFPKKYAAHEMADPAAYWRGMAYSLDKQFETTRGVMDAYLEKYPKGAHRGLATFRKAYAAHSLQDYDTSIDEFRDYLKTYPGHESNSEALILLGDALMAQGQIEEGIAAFKRIPPADRRFFEEGWFKTGKALRLMEQPDAMREHFVQFRNEHGRSPRVAEAIYWIGWVDRQNGEPDKARDVYWDAIDEFGDDASIRSVEDLFPALAKLYKGPEEQAQYLARLRDLREEADRVGKPTLAMRALWAQGAALKRSEPPRSEQLLVEASARVNVSNANPLLLADFAEALEHAGMKAEAAQMWRDLVKWNPRAPQKDRALAALGFAEMERGNERTALDYFGRFENETHGSLLVGKVFLAKARLEAERGQHDDARKSLESLLASQSAAGPEKAEALFGMGELYMKEGKPELAIPYYQRIYVMYGRWRDWVAKAYLRSGEAFEALKDTTSARKTYQEFTGREEFSEFQESAKARERLDQLGGPVES